MQLESLKIFCDVVRWASFSRGATENGVSQSSASQAVHQLEVRLGVKLIDRSKRPLVPTAQGKIYYDGCKDLVGRYLEVEGRVKGLEDSSNVVGTLGVSSIYSVGLAHMTRFVKEFGDRYPGVNVRLEYLHPTRVIESVSEGASELGLISFPKKWADLTVIPWRSEEMVLAVPPTHPLAARTEVGAGELDNEVFVSYDPDLPIRRAIDRFLRRNEVSFTVALEFDNIENIKRAVEISTGVAFLPGPTLDREIAAGTLVAVRVQGCEPERRLCRPLAAIHRRTQQLSLTAARFLELLTEEAGQASPSPSGGLASSTEKARPVLSKP